MKRGVTIKEIKEEDVKETLGSWLTLQKIIKEEITLSQISKL